MDFRVERVPYLAHVAGKLNHGASGAYFDLLKPLASEPIGDGLNICVGGAVKLAKFLRGEPLVKIRRVAAQLFIHEFAERGLLFGTALEKQEHTAHGCGV